MHTYIYFWHCRSSIDSMRAAIHKLHSSVARLERQYQTYNSQAKEQLQSLEGIKQQLPEYEQIVAEASPLQYSLEDKQTACNRLQVGCTMSCLVESIHL